MTIFVHIYIKIIYNMSIEFRFNIIIIFYPIQDFIIRIYLMLHLNLHRNKGFDSLNSKNIQK
jgi:hypothetical protein